MDVIETAAPQEYRTVGWLRSHGWAPNHREVWVDESYLNMQRAQQEAVMEARAWRAAEGLPQRPEPQVF
jgi:hypothetical protein